MIFLTNTLLFSVVEQKPQEYVLTFIDLTSVKEAVQFKTEIKDILLRNVLQKINNGETVAEITSNMSNIRLRSIKNFYRIEDKDRVVFTGGIRGIRLRSILQRNTIQETPITIGSNITDIKLTSISKFGRIHENSPDSLWELTASIGSIKLTSI